MGTMHGSQTFTRVYLRVSLPTQARYLLRTLQRASLPTTRITPRIIACLSFCLSLVHTYIYIVHTYLHHEHYPRTTPAIVTINV
jgi:hypothetical protein